VYQLLKLGSGLPFTDDQDSDNAIQMVPFAGSAEVEAFQYLYRDQRK
jgi:hypothetical protein